MAATHQPATPAVAALQKQPRRPINRIIPAVPHRFSRPPAARPLTPDESTTVTQREPDPDPETVPTQPEHSVAAAALETPPTPESRLSPADERNGDAHALASSPAHSADDQVEHASRTHGGYLLGRNPAKSRQHLLTLQTSRWDKQTVWPCTC